MHELLKFDRCLLLAMRRHELRAMTTFMVTVTHLGDAGSWIFVGLVLFAAGGMAAQWGARLAAAALTATALSQLFKRLVRRPRPSGGLFGFVALVENPDVFSFPSGHTAAATAVAVALVGPAPTLGVLFMLFAFCVAVSRVYLGAHYPLDVLCGAVVGLLSGALGPWLLALG